VLATDGEQAIGFAALIPRRLATTEGLAEVHVLTFFAVDPEYRGERIGATLARRLVEISDRPIVTFTEPGARSARALTQAAIDRGWTYKELATLRTYAGAGKSDRASAVARQATEQEFIAAIATPDPPTMAWSRPTLEQARHYLADPRGSCFAVAEGRDGETLGAALIVHSEVLTATGAECVPSLDAVHVVAQHTEALRAFRAFALDCGAPIVTAPNLCGMPADAIRSAGFRATRSAFNAAILGSPADAFVQRARATNLEVF
jgi:GNAT superfamily N-acetyltransferase